MIWAVIYLIGCVVSEICFIFYLRLYWKEGLDITVADLLMAILMMLLSWCGVIGLLHVKLEDITIIKGKRK